MRIGNASREPEPETARHEVYMYLQGHVVNVPVGEPLIRMLASQRAGQGAMPQRLGLDPQAWRAMMGRFFPTIAPESMINATASLDRDRLDEREELRALFLAHVESPTREHDWFATILATGCLGDDHLWQDLGLWSRKDLSGLINQCFPALAARNVADMKWKRFFYKQLCNQEGIYTCRAPSCEVCADYAVCFGPEA